MSNAGTRKVLGDITNTGRNQTWTKKHAKLTAVTDDADEIFLHKDEECIKAQHQEGAMELDYILKTFGLGNGWPQELPSVNKPESPSRSPPRLLEEILEQPISRFASPDPSPPKSPDGDHCWKCWEDREVNFKLLDSPKLVKD